MDDDLKKNLSSAENWIRIAFMLLFALALYIVAVLFAIVTCVQALFVLIGGEKNAALLDLSDRLIQYVKQCLDFLSYHSEIKPFPFIDWPSPSQAPEAANKAATSLDLGAGTEPDDDSDTPKRKPRARKKPSSEA